MRFCSTFDTHLASTLSVLPNLMVHNGVQSQLPRGTNRDELALLRESIPSQPMQHPTSSLQSKGEVRNTLVCNVVGSVRAVCVLHAALEVTVFPRLSKSTACVSSAVGATGRGDATHSCKAGPQSGAASLPPEAGT